LVPGETLNGNIGTELPDRRQASEPLNGFRSGGGRLNSSMNLGQTPRRSP